MAGPSRDTHSSSGLTCAHGAVTSSWALGVRGRAADKTVCGAQGSRLSSGQSHALHARHNDMRVLRGHLMAIAPPPRFIEGLAGLHDLE